MTRVKQAFGKARTALRLPAREKVWLALVYPLSGAIRLGLLVVPFRYFSPLLGDAIERRELSPLASPFDELAAWRIGRMCALAARYTPWESRCLVQAVMARTLLGFYGIPYAIYLGVMKSSEQDSPLKAHAWVKVGRWVVTGREGHQAFAVIAGYAAPGLIPRGTGGRGESGSE